MILRSKSRFALYFGTRGFFPGSLVHAAREQMAGLLRQWGHEVLMLDETATPYGAVESAKDGEVYARFLASHAGRFDGVILCLPNFGDENGAVAALKNAGVPILIQAYPDQLTEMHPDQRRDAYCGKLSIMDVFGQVGIRFTALKPHVVAPESAAFRANVEYFDSLCRVVRGMRNMVVGAIGARTTPFKTVRIDELALQTHGITVETMDMSTVITRAKEIGADGPAFKDKAAVLRATAGFGQVPGAAFDNMVRLGVVLDQIVEEFNLDAIAIRCWTELQQSLGVSPCVLLGVLNEHGVDGACEVDIGNAVVMRALSLASASPATLLDWNNNYAEQEDKCILFHCGPVPASLMIGKGEVTDHAILRTTLGDGCSYGCNQGRIQPFPFTFGGLLTRAGRVKAYLGAGRFTSDPIPAEFFGCAGVAEIPNLEDVLLHMGREGHRHHVALTRGQVVEPVREALGEYLGFDVSIPGVATRMPAEPVSGNGQYAAHTTTLTATAGSR